MLIQEVFELDGRLYIEKIAYFRVPVRLGADVFENGLISPEREHQLSHAMAAFNHILLAYRIENYRACATSAVREAANGPAVVESIKKATGIVIHPISGDVEADLIFSNFLVQEIDRSKNYMYIDVGGGSTELTLIKRGERQKSLSIQIGTVRAIKGKVSKKQWVEVRSWIRELTRGESDLMAIGTGGNINRMYKEANRAEKDTISHSEVEEYHRYISGFSYVERIIKLKMKPDRADVIVPATEIVSKIMGFANIQKMMVPKVGLADGIILELFHDWRDTTERSGGRM